MQPTLLTQTRTFIKENILRIKSFAFALRIVKLYQFLTESKREYILSKQLLRSGTSVGALSREAEQAESTADFTHKLSIALKEANETDYWFELLHQSNYLDQTEYHSIKTDITELIRLLTEILKTTKSNRKQ